MKRTAFPAVLAVGLIVAATCGSGSDAAVADLPDTAVVASGPGAPDPAAPPRAVDPKVAVPVRAPTAGPRAPEAAPADTAAAAVPGEQEEALRLLRGSAARYGAMRALRASFTMETRNPLLRETVRSRGMLYQRRPDRLLMRFEEPSGDVIVSDGRWIWVWYPSVDSAQVLRTPAAAGAGGVDLLSQFVGDPTERFTWTARPTESIGDRANSVIALDPRGSEAYRQLVVWIDVRDLLVRRFEITEHSGVVRRVDLRDVVVDPDLPDSLFRFDPPAGARIVGGL